MKSPTCVKLKISNISQSNRLHYEKYGTNGPSHHIPNPTHYISIDENPYSWSPKSCLKSAHTQQKYSRNDFTMSYHASPILRSLQSAQQQRKTTVTQISETTEEYLTAQTTAGQHEPYKNDGDKKHDLHRHLTLADRCKIATWIIAEAHEQGTEKRIQSKTITHFPQFFKGSPNSNFMRATRICLDRKKLFDEAPKSGERCSAMRSVSA